MNCSDLETWLIEELSGESLDPERKRQKEDHVNHCLHCQKNEAQLKTLFISLENLKQETISEPDPIYFSTLLQRTRLRLDQSSESFWSKLRIFLIPTSTYAWATIAVVATFVVALSSLNEIRFLQQKNIYSELSKEIARSADHSTNLEDNEMLIDNINDLTDDQLNKIIESIGEKS